MFTEGSEVGEEDAVGEEDEEGARAGELGSMCETLEERLPKGVRYRASSEEAGVHWSGCQPMEQCVEADGGVRGGAGEDEEAEARGAVKAFTCHDVFLGGE